ncbi:MAG: sigma 54-interacting transcriptional regulator [Peptococcaceae bacterium]|jgi:transcriptional regulator with PAS, ATPase and Fis domain|nr:sigma 54-interacting transcriptional regulator [Peptococcaceae bacterium]
MLSLPQDQDKQFEILREIAETYYGTILVTDRDARVLYVNQRAYDKYGIPPEQVLGLTVGDLIKRGLFNNSAALRTLVTQKPEIQYIENCIASPAVALSFPLFDQEGQLYRIISFSQDVGLPLNLVEKIDSERRIAVSAVDYLNNASQQDELVAESASMKQLVAFLEQISPYDITVILYGESGVGKEICARFIHRRSARAKHLFFPLNCATMPKELIESELFGYTGGAFTGARKEGKAGLFEIANQGTLFLDEIGELPMSVQSKLLRVIETGEYRRLGGNTIQYSNTRLIAATNRDLEKMVANGEFREDLYYRVNTLPLTIPPLRDRTDDIIPLAAAFLKVANQKFGKHKHLTPGTLESLKKYYWPGNARELRNVIEQLYVSSSKDALSFRDSYLLPYIMRRVALTSLTPGLASPAEAAAAAGAGRAPVEEKPIRQAMRDFERQYLGQILRQCNYNVSQAAEKLGIHRSVLYRKMEGYGLREPTPEIYS